MLYEEIKKRNKILRIFSDDSPTSPREWDNITKLCLFHNRYHFENDTDLNTDNFNSMEEIENQIIKQYKPVLIKPVYIYDHSGISLSLTNFNCRWDSGQIGFIFITEEDIIKFSGKYNKKNIKVYEKNLNEEFKTYNQYIEGEVFGYVLLELKEIEITKKYKDKTKTEKINTTEEKEIDSCWGYYGEEGIKQIKEENGFK